MSSRKTELKQVGGDGKRSRSPMNDKRSKSPTNDKRAKSPSAYQSIRDRAKSPSDKRQRDKSLVDHVNAAEKVLYDLRYVVKFMRNAAEAKRIQQEKTMAKDFEKQEELRRLEYLKNQEKSKSLHEAATRISLLYRARKARRMVREKRIQVDMEVVIKINSALGKKWIPFQRLFRQYSTRKWFGDRGIKYKLNRKKKKKRILKAGETAQLTIKPEDLSNRINFEVQQRRVVFRVTQIENLFRIYGQLLQTLDINLKHWMQEEKHLVPKETHFIHLKKKFDEDHRVMSIDVAAQKALVTPQQYEKLELQLRLISIKIEAAEQRAHVCINKRWWITQIIRANYRRQVFAKERFQDSLKRLVWVSDESATVSRIIFHMTVRLDKYKEKSDAKFVSEWLLKYLNYANLLQATLDANQEAIIMDEMNRLEKDLTTTLENDSLLQELMMGMDASSSYIAEKIILEQMSLISQKGSEEAVQFNQNLYSMKVKLGQLNASVIDTVKVGLQGKLTTEDEYHTNLIGFPNDNPDLPIHDMKDIIGVLLEPFRSHPHVKLEQFLDIYLLQPWQAAQAVDDVRIEETIRTKEIALDRLQVELKGLKAKIKEDQDWIKEITEGESEIQKQIGYYENLISVDGDSAEDPELGGKDDILAHIEEMYKGIEMNKVEINLKRNAMLSMTSLIPPVEERIDRAVEDILTRKAKFEEALKERARLCAVFFDMELEINQPIFEMVAHVATENHKTAAANEEILRFIEAVVGEERVRVVTGEDVGLEERQALGIPLGYHGLKYQQFLSLLRPRTESSAVKYLDFYRDSKTLQLRHTLFHLEFVKNLLDKEEKIISGFPDKVKYYSDCVDKYQASLLRQRRQRSLQRELTERKSKIADLRVDRLRMMKQVRDEKAADAQARQLAAEEMKKHQQESGMVRTAIRATKQAIRGGKDMIRNIIHQSNAGMSEEEHQMASVVRSKMKAGGGAGGAKQEAIRFVSLTKGEEETSLCQRKNDYLATKGLPYYRRMERSLGDNVYLWYQMSFDPTEFITHVELGPSDPKHADYRNDLKKSKYDQSTHKLVPMIVWTKKDIKRGRVVSDFMVTYTEGEEAKAVVEGYDKIEASLEKFGFPDAYVWVKKVDRLVASEAVSTNNVIQEIAKVRQLLKTKPNDTALISLHERLADQLQTAYHKEVLQEVTNPLQYAVELLNLNGAELEAWMAAFRRFDAGKEGNVRMEKLFDVINVPYTNVFKEVFHHVDAQNDADEIEFGDFMRACSIFCFFGREEILKFLYVYADKQKIGRITHDQFIAMLGELHPFDKTRAKRALKELVMVPGKEMDFYEFKDILGKYPALPHPMLNMQYVLREHTMGDEWWVAKLRKYKLVRNKITQAGANVDEIAAIEMERFAQDEVKNTRIANRETQIKNETSAIRKLILQARQFADEVG